MQFSFLSTQFLKTVSTKSINLFLTNDVKSLIKFCFCHTLIVKVWWGLGWCNVFVTEKGFFRLQFQKDFRYKLNWCYKTPLSQYVSVSEFFFYWRINVSMKLPSLWCTNFPSCGVKTWTWLGKRRPIQRQDNRDNMSSCLACYSFHGGSLQIKPVSVRNKLQGTFLIRGRVVNLKQDASVCFTHDFVAGRNIISSHVYPLTVRE